jgi:hypothetical protein
MAPADPPVPAALDALLREWRELQQGLSKEARDPNIGRNAASYCDGKAMALRFCADELEAALRAAGNLKNHDGRP